MREAMANGEDRVHTIDDRRFFIDSLGKIRLLPRFLQPRLGNGLSNSNIDLCRRSNVSFPIDFRQMLTIRRMSSLRILASYQTLAFYLQILHAETCGG